MGRILHDLSAPALVQAIEENLFEAFTLLGRWRRADVYDGADLLWSISDIPHPRFNSILRARLSPDMVDVAITATLARGRSKQVPLLWWTGPSTRPGDLAASLTVRGFVPVGCLTGMAVDLSALREESATQPDLRVERVHDLPSFRAWCHVAATALGFGEFEDALGEQLSQVGLANPVLHHYLAWQGEEPVATSSLFLGASVAGVLNVATIAPAQGESVVSAVSTAPLCEARGLGYRVGVLAASTADESVYRRLGFQACCRIGHYLWQGGTRCPHN